MDLSAIFPSSYSLPECTLFFSSTFNARIAAQPMTCFSKTFPPLGDNHSWLFYSFHNLCSYVDCSMATNWENTPKRLDCKQVCRMLSWLMIDVGVPRTLWAILLWGGLVFLDVIRKQNNQATKSKSVSRISNESLHLFLFPHSWLDIIPFLQYPTTMWNYKMKWSLCSPFFFFLVIVFIVAIEIQLRQSLSLEKVELANDIWVVNFYFSKAS